MTTHEPPSRVMQETHLDVKDSQLIAGHVAAFGAVRLCLEVGIFEVGVGGGGYRYK